MWRLYDAEPVERERVVQTLAAVLVAEPDLEFAWLHGSFLGGGSFRDVDVGVHLSAPAEVCSHRALALGLRLDRDTGFPVDVRVLNDAQSPSCSTSFGRGACCSAGMTSVWPI